MIILNFDEHGLYGFSAVERELMLRICETVEPEIRRHLPDLVSNIELRIEGRQGPDVIPQIGCGATSLTPSRVSFVVDPSRPGGVRPIIHDHLRHLLFHECHHLVRGWVRSAPRAETFMHGVVCEGLATAFERDAAGVAPPWGDYPRDVADWVEELLALPPSAPYVQWMFFHPDGRLWIGYRAGTYIADQAIRRSGRSAAQLVGVDTQSILDMAGVL